MSTDGTISASDQSRVSTPLVLDRNHRSRMISDPLKAIRRGSVDGRAVYDLAVRLLAKIPGDRTDPVVVADVVSVAELRVRAAKLRADPTSDIHELTRIERLVELRMRRLGLAPARAERRLTRFIA
jgi:hypothetical protein